MQWKEFTQSVPEIATVGETRFGDDGFGFLGTIRRDGTPRISPIETTFATGRLILGMPHKSLKAIDLKRDPRCTIHSAVANKENKEGDFKLSGIADEILEESLFKILADMAEKESGWRPPFRAAFYVTIDVKSASYVNSSKRQVLVWEEVSGLREMTIAGVGD